MTDRQAQQIKTLRMQGKGYKAIASATGLSRDIVRNYCKAKGIAGFCEEKNNNRKEKGVFLQDKLKKCRMAKKLNREMVECFVERIRIFEDGKIEVGFADRNKVLERLGG